MEELGEVSTRWKTLTLLVLATGSGQRGKFTRRRRLRGLEGWMEAGDWLWEQPLKETSQIKYEKIQPCHLQKSV